MSARQPFDVKVTNVTVPEVVAWPTQQPAVPRRPATAPPTPPLPRFAPYNPYPEKFEPTLAPGDIVAVVLGATGGLVRVVYGQVRYILPVQPYILDLGPLSAATLTQYPATGNAVTPNFFKLGQNALGQWHLELLDPFALDVNLPNVISLWATLYDETPMNLFSDITPSAQWVYTYQDTYIPTLKPMNIQYVPMPAARVLVKGFKYYLVPARRLEDTGEIVVYTTPPVKLPADTPIKVVPVVGAQNTAAGPNIEGSELGG